MATSLPFSLPISLLFTSLSLIHHSRLCFTYHTLSCVLFEPLTFFSSLPPPPVPPFSSFFSLFYIPLFSPLPLSFHSPPPSFLLFPSLAPSPPITSLVKGAVWHLHNPCVHTCLVTKPSTHKCLMVIIFSVCSR